MAAFIIALVGILLTVARPAVALHENAHQWDSRQIAILRSLWIGSLGPVPDDPSNRFDTSPAAVVLGRKLFFDQKLSANGQVSCATCHIPDKGFTDNLPVAHGIADSSRRSMPLAGTAYSPWLFWDGRADSLWAQALGPIENPKEHGISRTFCVLTVRRRYRAEYEDIFGPMPNLPEADIPVRARPATDDEAALALWQSLPERTRLEINRVYANIGKAIAAFVRTIQPGAARFDNYVRAVLRNDRQAMEKIFSRREAAGLKVFIGTAQCINCHNGPLFTNFDFHRVGVGGGPDGDRGRAGIINRILTSEFNCLGPYSDASPEDCAELRFMNRDPADYEGAFKTPSLRNVADRPPYMHAGQFKTLNEVLRFYQRTARNRPTTGVAVDIVHGAITDDEVLLLEAFLKTLSGPVSAAR